MSITCTRIFAIYGVRAIYVCMYAHICIYVRIYVYSCMKSLRGLIPLPVCVWKRMHACLCSYIGQRYSNTHTRQSPSGKNLPHQIVAMTLGTFLLNQDEIREVLILLLSPLLLSLSWSVSLCRRKSTHRRSETWGNRETFHVQDGEGLSENEAENIFQDWMHQIFCRSLSLSLSQTY